MYISRNLRFVGEIVVYFIYTNKYSKVYITKTEFHPILVLPLKSVVALFERLQ